MPYAIRGSIWCQGESNNDGEGSLYAARLEALANGWRSAWGIADMPFYFTQMQVYGSTPNPDEVGMAEVSQAQLLFYKNNRKNTGMVVQIDLNPAVPGNIHYFNKLHPGMRLARWALARDYDKDIPYTGPIYAGYEVKGSEVIVSFEKDSLFGGLMVGSKGEEKDFLEPDKYVEPARPTSGEKLNHFRLCGKDRRWHAAEARIAGDTVVAASKDVPDPVGVQYAYMSAPLHANLYNKAGLALFALRGDRWRIDVPRIPTRGTRGCHSRRAASLAFTVTDIPQRHHPPARQADPCLGFCQPRHPSDRHARRCYRNRHRRQE